MHRRLPPLFAAHFLLAVVLAACCLGSPVTPKFPSTLNFQAFNVIACPATEAEWSFEIAHTDLAVASDHLSGLRARNADICLLSYQLLHSGLVSNTEEQTDLEKFAASSGKDVEEAYLHYYDDTTVKFGNGQTVTIRGFGGGTATSLKEARIRNFIWADERYIFNPKSTLFRQFEGTRFRTIITTGLKPDGIFVDETSPLTAFVAQPISGGHIREYANKTAEEAASEYEIDMANAFADVNEAMGHDGPFGDRIILGNVAEWVDAALNIGLRGADGVCTEIISQEIQPRSPHLYDLAKQFADAGKIFLVSQGGYAPLIDDPGNYSSPMDRHQMFSLTEYWIAKQGKSTYYCQTPSGYVTMDHWWCKAREYDVGTPVDAMYSIWQTGTDSAGQQYKIYKRAYTKALMLCRPKVGWVYNDYATRSRLYDLDGTYRLLHSDGTLGPEIGKIGLAMGEAVTLIRTGDTPPPDTAAPIISGTKVGNVASSSAVISWLTDEVATGTIEYGPTTSYGLSTPAPNPATSQEVTLLGLSGGTTYHYRVTAMDAAGNRSVSADGTFTTQPSSSGGSPSPTGYIRHWAALGPFNFADGAGHNTDYIGETTIRPSVGDTTAGKTWIDYACFADQLDLAAIFKPSDYAVAYLNVYVYSDRARTCQLRIGIDDAGKAFLNGALVCNIPAYRPSDPDANIADVTLQAGWNQLLVKAENLTVAWTLYARFTDMSGNIIPELTYRVDQATPVEIGAAKITVTISVDKTTAKVGEQLVYTVTYTNSGTAPANSAIVRADVDPHVRFVSATNGGVYDAEANVVRWNVGTVAPGASSSVQYTVVVK